MNVKIDTDSKSVRNAIKNIGTTGKKLDGMIHSAALSVLWHLSQHRDKTLFKGLVDAMPKSSRAKGLVDWFNRNSSGAFEAMYEGSMDLEPIDSDEWLAFVENIDEVIENADAKPFWDKPEKGDKDKPDLTKLLEYITRYANKRDLGTADKEAAKRIAEFARSIKEQATAPNLSLDIPFPGEKMPENRPAVH